MWSVEFGQKLLLVVVPILLAGVALWTWQRKYWEYQLRRQTEDWKQRRRYSRKESQREFMETLLIEMNQEVERFASKALLAASAIYRRLDYIQRGGNKEGARKWDLEVNRSVDAFNSCEEAWLTDCRVIEGKLSLYFSKEADRYVDRWQHIVKLTEGMCSLFHDRDSADLLHAIWDRVSKIRAEKNGLMIEMQEAIDRFVFEVLEARGAGHDA